jgi:Family of unknown function (DUF5681)
MTDAASATRKQPGRPFRKGHSGNPAGRPSGSRNQASIMAEKLMADESDAIVRTVIDAAKGGDMVAARLVLERLCPVRKGRPVTIDLPKVEGVNDLVVALGAVTHAMAAGEITPDEAATVAGVLDVKRRTFETIELERRIAALERRSNGGG